MKFVASVEGNKIFMLRYFGENDGVERPINKDEYEFRDGSIQYIVPEYAKNLTSRYRSSVDELVFRMNALSEEVYKHDRRLERIEESNGVRPKNKITISISGARLVVGREINRPNPLELVGWRRIFMLDLSGLGGWRSVVWIKGIWEHNSLGEPK